MTKVSASILSDFIKATDIVKELDKTNVDFIHLDIMDGKFVENKSWTYGEIKKIVSYTNKKLDAHFMVKDPQKYIEDYALLNTEYFTFHFETVKDINEMINLVKSYGLRVGISINTDNDGNVLFPYLKSIDLVLIMSVIPGKSGQGFIEDTPDKISKLKEEITKTESKTLIEVDGGINDETGKLCLIAGADILVSASYIHKNIKDNVNILKNL
jgi:ribulose-phosphate 3-epimerase